MSEPEMILTIILIVVMVFLAVKMHRSSSKRAISFAENKVKEYLTAKGYTILSLTSRQKEIKTKGLHIGVKIKALILNNKGEKIELILLHNELTNNIKILSERIL